MKNKQKNRPGVTKGRRPAIVWSSVSIVCVKKHMFLLYGSKPYAGWRKPVCHLFLLCGARPYVSIVWRSTICFYCVAVCHMFLFFNSSLGDDDSLGDDASVMASRLDEVVTALLDAHAPMTEITCRVRWPSTED